MKKTIIPAPIPPVPQATVILEMTENEYAFLQHMAVYYAVCATLAAASSAAHRFAENKKSVNWALVSEAFK